MNRERIWYLAAKKLSGEANPGELNELENLLRQDPDTHYALQNISDIWHLPRQTHSQASEAFQRHLERMEKSGINWPEENGEEEEDEPQPLQTNRRPRWVSWLSVMATMIIAVSALYFSDVFRLPAQSRKTSMAAQTAGARNEISTRNGSKTRISLPDGSKVWLNSGSTLTYSKDFGNGLREVNLSGEAFFDVVKNPSLPFVIHTRQIDVRVLGTAFNVKSYPEDKETETSLIRGSVEVRIHNRPNEKIILKPNEKLVVKNDEIVMDSSQRKIVNSSNAQAEAPLVVLSHLTHSQKDTSVMMETAWVQNKLVFDNEAFADLASKLERWYAVQVEFRDESVKQLRFSGIFEDESIEQALEALSITAGGFHFDIQANKVAIFK